MLDLDLLLKEVFGYFGGDAFPEGRNPFEVWEELRDAIYAAGRYIKMKERGGQANSPAHRLAVTGNFIRGLHTGKTDDAELLQKNYPFLKFFEKNS